MDTTAVYMFVQRAWLAVARWLQWLVIEFIMTWLESIELRIACFIILLQCSTMLFVWIIVRHTQRPLQYVFCEAPVRDIKDN